MIVSASLPVGSIKPPSKFCCFPAPVFNKTIFDTFKYYVDLLVTYEQSIDRNQRITRRLNQVIDLRKGYNLSGKYPIHLETIYAVHKLFYAIILNTTAPYTPPLTEVEASYIREEIVKLLTTLNSGEEKSSVILSPDQIREVRKKITPGEHPTRKTTLLIEQIFSSKTLIDPLKYAALASLIDLQTDSQVRQFFVENLDRLINLIQSNTPLEEFLPLLTAYSIHPSRIQAMRDYINKSSPSLPRRNRLTILYLLQTVDNGNQQEFYKIDIINALRFKQTEILPEYLKEELDTLIHSVEYELPFSLDQLFLTPGLTVAIQNSFKEGMSSDEKDYITTTHLINVVESNPRIFPVKHLVLPLLQKKQSQFFKLFNLNRLIDLISSNNSIHPDFLNLYKLTQKQIQDIRNYIQQESIVIDRLLKMIPSSETALIERLTYKKEIPFLIGLILGPKLSDDLFLQAKQLARKYGFNPENVSSLKRILKDRVDIDYLRGKLVDSIHSGIFSLRHKGRFVKSRKVAIEVVKETLARL